MNAFDQTITELGLIRDPNAKTESYFCQYGEQIVLRPLHVMALKHRLAESGEHILRISLHESPASDFHQMIIVQRRRDGEIRPHKHLSKDESHHVIEGVLVVEAHFDDRTLVTRLGAPGSGLPIMDRIKAGVYHATIAETEFVVFHESKPGPFNGSDSIFL